MRNISKFINGTPYGKSKTKGDIEAPSRWSKSIIEQTSKLPKVQEACIAKITFYLPEDKFPTDYPFGPDLDNLLKRFLDALNETILAEAQGKDSCIISFNVSKAKVANVSEAGVHLEIIPVKL